MRIQVTSVTQAPATSLEDYCEHVRPELSNRTMGRKFLDSESDGNTDDTTQGVPSPRRTKLSVSRTKKGSAKQTEFIWRTADIKPNEQLQWEPEQSDVSQLPNYLTLVEEPTAKGLACTGTIRANRTSDCPLVDMKQLEKQPRGTYDHKSENSTGVLMARWNDNSVVTVISNFYGIEPIQSASTPSNKNRACKFKR
ncbi:PiggyBac transposable element-derived protein 2 [Elysia marginata]|uniref:PiggyBac transposable element-derived protein 2 n=1 Tax=Elysia marginata TaxID=1093978 RepID=A0AAV4EU04_9GAST|nr:PiggyBac transposable element-derived protein 2 [Elysia marginata]